MQEDETAESCSFANIYQQKAGKHIWEGILRIKWGRI